MNQQRFILASLVALLGFLVSVAVVLYAAASPYAQGLMTGVALTIVLAAFAVAFVATGVVAGIWWMQRQRQPQPAPHAVEPRAPYTLSAPYRWYDGSRPVEAEYPLLATPDVAQWLNSATHVINETLQQHGINAWVSGGRYAGAGVEFAVRLGVGAMVNDVKAALSGIPGSRLSQSGTHVILRVAMPQYQHQHQAR